jgi:hypothetical protein
MKKTVLRYGAWAALFEFICFVLIWLIIDITHIDHETQGTIGWINLLCPLIFVYFGIRYYRDKVNGGYINFLQALKLGMLIVIIPAVSFAIIESVYVLVIQPKFYENITNYDIEQYRKVLPPAKFALKVKEMKEELALNNNPFYNFTVMVLMISALGSIMTLASAVLLSRRPNKVAAEN